MTDTVRCAWSCDAGEIRDELTSGLFVCNLPEDSVAHRHSVECPKDHEDWFACHGFVDPVAQPSPPTDEALGAVKVGMELYDYTARMLHAFDHGDKPPFKDCTDHPCPKNREALTVLWPMEDADIALAAARPAPVLDGLVERYIDRVAPLDLIVMQRVRNGWSVSWQVYNMPNPDSPREAAVGPTLQEALAAALAERTEAAAGG